MQATIEFVKPTVAKLNIEASADDINEAKLIAVTKLSNNLRIPGFRPGKVPLNVAEKHLDENILAQEVLEVAVNDLYTKAIIDNKLRTVDRPEVTIKEFVPFESLKFETTVEVIGKVKLGKYNGLKVDKSDVKVSAKEINEVIKQLQKQSAERVESNKPASDGDEVIIDFDGFYAINNEPIDGGSGKDYPLVLGSNTFIPGFEPNLVGLKTSESKEFEVTFPNDYSVSSLKGKKAKFRVTINKVNSMKLPKLDDKFASQSGPFKTLEDLKADIKKQLRSNKENEVAAQFQNELVALIVDASEVDLPESLIIDEVGRFERDQRQNAAYSGLTWKEYLQAEGLSEQDFTRIAQDQAKQRIKAGLVLGEIANTENISVSKNELADRISKLKLQYTEDASMLAELEKPQNQEDIKNRILVEKTVQLLEKLNS